MNARLAPVDPMQTNLSSLRTAAASRDPRAAAATARQFESVLTEHLVKSMRQASGGNALFPGENSLYQEMYDREIATKLSQGRGLGLASVIERSLGGAPASSTANAEATRAYSLAAYPRTLPPQRVPAAPSTTALPPATAAARSIAPAAADRFPTGPVPHAIPAANVAFAGVSAPGRFSSPPAKPSFESPEAFVAAIWPHAVRTAADLGVSPRMLVAQTALETGWGRHVAPVGDGASGNNLFGIKTGAGWTGERTTSTTQEYVDGTMRRTTAQFRAYDGIGASFDDYARLLKSSRRYADALAAGTDEANFAQALQRAGYATDPAYAAKLVGIANGPALERALKNVDAGPLMAAR